MSGRIADETPGSVRAGGDAEVFFSARSSDSFGDFDRTVAQRLGGPEFEQVNRHEALTLCRTLYGIAGRDQGRPAFAEAVADAAGGAARRGLAPRAAFRVVGLALNLLGLEMPVGVGRSLKQFMFEGA